MCIVWNRRAEHQGIQGWVVRRRVRRDKARNGDICELGPSRRRRRTRVAHDNVCLAQPPEDATTPGGGRHAGRHPKSCDNLYHLTTHPKMRPLVVEMLGTMQGWYPTHAGRSIRFPSCPLLRFCIIFLAEQQQGGSQRHALRRGTHGGCTQVGTLGYTQGIITLINLDVTRLSRRRRPRRSDGMGQGR